MASGRGLTQADSYSSQSDLLPPTASLQSFSIQEPPPESASKGPIPSSTPFLNGHVDTPGGNSSYSPRQTTFRLWLWLLADLTIALVPVVFVVLGIAAATLNQAATAENSSLGSRVERAMKIGPTIFPILFAAIAARSLRSVARYQAERVAKLGSLEMLVGSRSVWATMEMAFHIRSFTTTTIFLILFWILSPLGGQAALRLMTRKDANNSSPLTVRYFDTGPAAGIWPNGGFGPVGTQFESIENIVFSAAIVSPDTIKRSSQDTWGNIKIPRLEAFNSSTPDKSGWIVISSQSDGLAVEDYFALVGLPTVGIPSTAKSNFTLESSYLSLGCAKPVKSVYTKSLWNQTVGQIWNGLTTNDSNPLSPSDDSGDANSAKTFFLDTNLPLENGARLQEHFGLPLDLSTANDPLLNATRHIVFGSVSDEGSDDSFVGNMTTVNCTIASTHVESKISCAGEQNCTVTRIRRSLQDTRSSKVSVFDSSVLSLVLRSLPETGGSQGQVVSSPVEIFINDTSVAPYSRNVFGDGFVDLSNVSAANFSTRLGIILNTYFQILTFPTAFLGDGDSNLTLYGPDTTPIDAIKTWFGSNATLDNIMSAIDNSADSTDMALTTERASALDAAPWVAATSTGVVIVTHEIFVTSLAWVAILIICSTALIVVALAGAILNAYTVAPDMLGYVASSTYRNADLDGLPAALPLDAMARAKKLKDFKVRIGAKEDGSVAFTAGHMSDALTRRKRYT